MEPTKQCRLLLRDRLIMWPLTFLLSVALLTASYFIGSQREAGKRESELRRSAWRLVMCSGTNSISGTNRLVAVDCPCGLLLDILQTIDRAASILDSDIDTRASDVNALKYRIRDKLNRGPSRYHTVLPVLAGALHTLNLSFEDFLYLRQQIASQIAAQLRSKQGMFWLYTVRRQEQAVNYRHSSVALRDCPSCKTNGCCNRLIAYLDGSPRAGIDYEYWIAFEGAIYASTPRHHRDTN